MPFFRRAAASVLALTWQPPLTTPPVPGGKYTTLLPATCDLPTFEAEIGQLPRDFGWFWSAWAHERDAMGHPKFSRYGESFTQEQAANAAAGVIGAQIEHLRQEAH